ncbi:hypothetical protein BHM03_00055216 [Ensete ventricosum]|uniref:Uncharacterized protein n=1 Tax=Ensete ventricosum TaxID=4639 RepID=A0A445MM90_ENSVE|nr:hypothetical protein BHM03_00055216 [Ensete ventricosum]
MVVFGSVRLRDPNCSCLFPRANQPRALVDLPIATAPTLPHRPRPGTPQRCRLHVRRRRPSKVCSSNLAPQQVSPSWLEGGEGSLRRGGIRVGRRMQQKLGSRFMASSPCKHTFGLDRDKARISLSFPVEPRRESPHVAKRPNKKSSEFYQHESDLLIDRSRHCHGDSVGNDREKESA